MNVQSPILFIVFNRPQTTRAVFEAIRAARPVRLYVAADGPRASRPAEPALCEEVRGIATAVDWPCELKVLARPANLGCKVGVSSAIDWFFEQEPEGIVLEDDCVPHSSFFAYCDELLARYRHDPRVMCISGDNFISGHWMPQASYYFSRYIHIWGWATWRRAWSHYDVTLSAWRNGDRSAALERWFPDQPRAAEHWRRILDRVADGAIDTWDYQWVYACWAHGGLSCMPARNLIKNIGFGPEATHTLSPEHQLANLPVAALELPLRHPVGVVSDDAADAWTSRHVFGIDESVTRLARLRARMRDAIEGLGR